MTHHLVNWVGDEIEYRVALIIYMSRNVCMCNLWLANNSPPCFPLLSKTVLEWKQLLRMRDYYRRTAINTCEFAVGEHRYSVLLLFT